MFRLSSIVVLIFGFGSLIQADAPKTKRILWAGSSSTYYHDLPERVTEALEAFGKEKTIAQIVGRSGDGIHHYLRTDFDRYQYGVKNGQTFLQKVQEEKYDLVVLQVVAGFIAGKEGDEHRKAIDTYCKAIRDAGGEPVFYEMGWGQGETHERGMQKLFEAARENKVRFYAPCAQAWMRVRKEKPDLELHNLPDRTHPGTLGTYLNVCCFYATLTEKSPIGMPRQIKIWIPKKTDEEKAAAQKTLASATITSPYVKALPKWMQANSVTVKSIDIEPETATYLQTIAWETWQANQKRLLAK